MSAATGFLFLLVVILSLIGVLGAVLPALPGPPLCLAALFVAWFVRPAEISTAFLGLMTVLTALGVVIDYVAPIWLTKIGGGSKEAVRWSTIGMVAGLFFMPLGLILGPLVGAFVGEMMSSADVNKSVRVALLSFVAFLLTTGAKMILALVLSYYAIVAFL